MPASRTHPTANLAVRPSLKPYTAHRCAHKSTAFLKVRRSEPTPWVTRIDGHSWRACSFRPAVATIGASSAQTSQVVSMAIHHWAMSLGIRPAQSSAVQSHAPSSYAQHPAPLRYCATNIPHIAAHKPALAVPLVSSSRILPRPPDADLSDHMNRRLLLKQVVNVRRRVSVIVQ